MFLKILNWRELTLKYYSDSNLNDISKTLLLAINSEILNYISRKISEVLIYYESGIILIFAAKSVLEQFILELK